jgi:hypothetical protein
MSAATGIIGAVVILTAEEILVASKGGPSAVKGAVGLLSTAISKISDPNVAAVPNRGK